MKKFKFTLESLKKYNEQILDSEKNTLGRLRAEYADMQKALEAKELEYEQAIEKLEELMKSGTNVMRVSLHKRYIASLQQDMYRIKAEMAAKDEEIQKQLYIAEVGIFFVICAYFFTKEKTLNIGIKIENMDTNLHAGNDFYEYAKVDGVGQMAGWLPHKNKEESLSI